MEIILDEEKYLIFDCQDLREYNWKKCGVRVPLENNVFLLPFSNEVFCNMHTSTICFGNFESIKLVITFEDVFDEIDIIVKILALSYNIRGYTGFDFGLMYSA